MIVIPLYNKLGHKKCYCNVVYIVIKRSKEIVKQKILVLKIVEWYSVKWLLLFNNFTKISKSNIDLIIRPEGISEIKNFYNIITYNEVTE